MWAQTRELSGPNDDYSLLLSLSKNGEVDIEMKWKHKNRVCVCVCKCGAEELERIHTSSLNFSFRIIMQ